MSRILLSLFLTLFLLIITFQVPVFAADQSSDSASATTAPAPQGPRRRIITPVKVPDSVYALMTEHKELSKFIDLIDDADLKDYFKSQGDAPLTVFAPTNDAISDLSRDIWKKIKANQASMQSFVKYHVISGSNVPLSSIAGRRASLSAANGDSIGIDGLTKKDAPKVNGAGLVASDLPAANGIVHIVNAAFIPSSMLDQPKTQPAPPPYFRKESSNNASNIGVTAVSLAGFNFAYIDNFGYHSARARGSIIFAGDDIAECRTKYHFTQYAVFWSYI